MKWLRYFWYVVRHKWFVFVECSKNGQLWLGLTHDWSKFLPSEFFPYAEFFYGRKPNCYICNHIAGNQCDVNYSGIGQGEQATNCEDYSILAFDFAWLLHQKRNRHHWQWWILPEDEGGIKVLEMETKYRMEMICDWKGASRAQGHGGSIAEWWDKNNHKMFLHPETRKIIERYVIELERKLEDADADQLEVRYSSELQ